jgi:hypothetical protein
MKIFWLDVMPFVYAVIIGVTLGLVIVFATTPHPVAVPTQMITPVPTPPPVVITQSPVQSPALPDGTYMVSDVVVPMAQTQLDLINLIFAMAPVIILLTAIAMIFRLLNGFMRGGDF